MGTYLMDCFQIAFWIMAILGGGVAAYTAIRQNEAGRQQRVTELRWKQANIGKQLLDDIHHHPSAAAAILMLDWIDGSHEHVIGPDHIEAIRHDDIIAALQKNRWESVSQKDTYIRDSFDWFFYFVDRLEHYVRRQLIEFADVEAVFKPYAKKLAENVRVYEEFMQFHEYELASNFFGRYKQSICSPSR